MAIYQSKHFGEVNLEKTEEYYDSEITLSEEPTEVTIDFNVVRSIDNESFNKIEEYIDNLKTHEATIRNLIQNDFEENGFAKAYIDSLLEYQDEEDLNALIEESENDIGLEKKLLSALQLLRVVIYPDKDDKVFAVYDYTISEELTNDLLVVIVSKDGGIRMTVES